MQLQHVSVEKRCGLFALRLIEQLRGGHKNSSPVTNDTSMHKHLSLGHTRSQRDLILGGVPNLSLTPTPFNTNDARM